MLFLVSFVFVFEMDSLCSLVVLELTLWTSWPQTKRLACFYLLRAGIKGLHWWDNVHFLKAALESPDCQNDSGLALRLAPSDISSLLSKHEGSMLSYGLRPLPTTHMGKHHNVPPPPTTLGTQGSFLPLNRFFFPYDTQENVHKTT